MAKGLKRKDIEKLLSKLRTSVPRKECWSCECLQGFLAQLEIDSLEDISGLIKALKVSNKEMHSCLGCQPCPPGEVYSGYSCKQR